eukprot:2953086-Amphidinium_carterae.1
MVTHHTSVSGTCCTGPPSPPASAPELVHIHTHKKQPKAPCPCQLLRPSKMRPVVGVGGARSITDEQTDDGNEREIILQFNCPMLAGHCSSSCIPIVAQMSNHD